MATIPCPTCGHPNHDTARFCEECATPLAAAPPPAVTPPSGQPSGYPVGAPMPAPTGGAPDGRAPNDAVRNALIAALVVLVGVAVVLVVLVARGDGDDGADEDFDDVAATSITTSTTTTSTTTTTTTTTTPPPPDEGGGLFGLPSGLFCRDLAARGYSYADSVAYWESEGRPDRMDADRNGYPCETVYPSDEVIAYWGFDPQGGGGGGVAGLPSGLFCRDLAARGYSYADSVAYWELEGRPDRMDADRNGYPCETVYPAADVIAYWGFDPP